MGDHLRWISFNSGRGARAVRSLHPCLKAPGPAPCRSMAHSHMPRCFMASASHTPQATAPHATAVHMYRCCTPSRCMPQHRVERHLRSGRVSHPRR